MIKFLTATTREVDDAQAAAAEITEALGIGKNLLKNSLGIVSCFSEFEDTGALKAICDALPFDCIGTTTCLCATGEEIDQVIFAIAVLTSDDCSFQTALIPISDDCQASIDPPMADLLSRCGERPGLFLSYFPLINTISGDMMLAAIDKATGGIPLFGTTAVDHTRDYSSSKTIYNGAAYREAAVLGALCGNFKAEFEVTTLNEDKTRKQKAIITEAVGNVLISVNGKPALDYLEEIGLKREDIISGLGVIPLLVYHKDGSKPVPRAVFTSTPEGHAICGGVMQEGATLALGRVDMNDVFVTTEEALKPLLEKDSLILSYSCIARYLVLGTDINAEAEKVRGAADGIAPYLFTCSGGEICPIPDGEGNLKNYFHNYTNVFCKLR